MLIGYKALFIAFFLAFCLFVLHLSFEWNQKNSINNFISENVTKCWKSSWIGYAFQPNTQTFHSTVISIKFKESLCCAVISAIYRFLVRSNFINDSHAFTCDLWVNCAQKKIKQILLESIPIILIASLCLGLKDIYSLLVLYTITCYNFWINCVFTYVHDRWRSSSCIP